MNRTKLSYREKVIERALMKSEYRDVSQTEYEEIARTIAWRKKDAVLNIRVNGHDLKALKQKAKRLGVPYQSLISELLHRFAA